MGCLSLPPSGFGELFRKFGVAHLRNNTENALCNPIGENIRPLVHRLVRDAHGLSGSGYGSAEDFDGLRFLHAADLTTVKS